MNPTIVPVKSDHYPLFEKWFNDAELVKWLPAPFCNANYNAAFHKFWLARRDNVIRVIFVGDRAVGYAGAELIDFYHKTGVMQMLIGEAEYRNAGVGYKAGLLLLDELFEVHGLHAIHAWAVETNAPSIRIIEKGGFKKVGTYRRCHLIDGAYRDRIHYDLLREEHRR